MSLSKKTRIILKYIVPSVLVMVVVPLLQRTVRNEENIEGDTLRCVIAVKNSPKMRYAVGYNFEMLKLYAEQLGKAYDISIGDASSLDSLKAGKTDIIVLPFSDSLIFDKDFYSSIPLADSSAWIIDGRLTGAHKDINHWLSSFCLSDKHTEIVSRFTPGYEPHRRHAKGWKYKTLSPYDKLITKYAAELGWSRYMLTALVWQESKFHIEANSRRGAVGLMQLMPRTADRFQADDLLDPEDNMRTGVTYLKHLQGMFRKYTSSSEELMNFTLAAYNAGEGRILDCINYAASIGAPHSRWEDIVAVIPDMREDSIMESDTVKLGKFKGYETIAYVQNMDHLCSLFESISSTGSSGIKSTDRTSGDNKLNSANSTSGNTGESYNDIDNGNCQKSATEPVPSSQGQHREPSDTAAQAAALLPDKR